MAAKKRIPGPRLFLALFARSAAARFATRHVDSTARTEEHLTDSLSEGFFVISVISVVQHAGL
jgi:hypothetical protein